MVRPRPQIVAAARSRARSLVVATAFAFGLVTLAGLAPRAARAEDPPKTEKTEANKVEAKKSSPEKATVKATKAPPDSLPALEAAARKDSTNVKAQYRLGIAYLDRDLPSEATKRFQRAVTLKPDYVEAWVNLGAAQDAEGHGGVARISYREALRLRPADEIAMCRLASSFYASGMKDSAMSALREQLKTNPKSNCAYFTLGVAFADAGMYREAIKAWQQVIDLAPTSPEAQSARETTKLLQEYLGPQDALAQPVVTPGVPPGSGGPNSIIPGGGMMNSGSSTAPATKASAQKPGAKGKGKK